MKKLESYLTETDISGSFSLFPCNLANTGSQGGFIFKLPFTLLFLRFHQLRDEFNGSMSTTANREVCGPGSGLAAAAAAPADCVITCFAQ